MVGTERSLLGERGPELLEPPPAHVKNPVGAMNEAWVVSRRGMPPEELLAEFVEVTGRRLDALRAMGADRFDEVGPSPVGQVPYREFMSVRVMDCWVHEQDMRVATGKPGHRSGPVAELAMARLTSAIPYVVGKKAAASEGESLRLTVSGPTPSSTEVVVRDGRAVVAAIDGEPTAVVEMDAQVFWRLACGRLAGADARNGDLVALSGRLELGRRVVDGLAFMI
jgi:uncharacterized protein (TIGR03083 family)